MDISFGDVDYCNMCGVVMSGDRVDELCPSATEGGHTTNTGFLKHVKCPVCHSGVEFSFVHPARVIVRDQGETSYPLAEGFPDNDELVTCGNCGHIAPGYSFRVKTRKPADLSLDEIDAFLNS